MRRYFDNCTVPALKLGTSARGGTAAHNDAFQKKLLRRKISQFAAVARRRVASMLWLARPPCLRLLRAQPSSSRARRPARTCRLAIRVRTASLYIRARRGAAALAPLAEMLSLPRMHAPRSHVRQPRACVAYVMCRVCMCRALLAVLRRSLASCVYVCSIRR